MYNTPRSLHNLALGLLMGLAVALMASPASAQVTITPTTATVVTGGKQQFTSQPSTGVTWSVSPGGGSIDATGLYTAGSLTGTYTITALSGTQTATATVTVVNMLVSPDTVSLTPQQTQVFTATPATGVTWSTTGASNVISNAGLFTAGNTPGTYTVTATGPNGISATATVTIATMLLTPSTATLDTGGTQQFTTTPATFPNGTTVTWSVTAGGGQISNTGLYTAGTTPGTYTVTATAGAASATATVTVVQPLVIDPATVTIGAGATQQFTATPGAGVTWTVTGTGNTITTTGLFTAGDTAGSYTVTATNAAGKKATATVTVTSQKISPTTAKVAPGGTQQFTANPSTGVTWTVTGAGNTIDNNGKFTAGTAAGTFTVTATSSNGEATATVTVGGSGTLTVSPTTTSMLPGSTQLFTATPAGGVVWSATGGTINTSGFYTAGTTPGDFTVTATSPSGVGTATVKIASIVISPDSATLKPGGTQVFTVKPASTVTWSVSPGGGTISASGMYTAPDVPGTYTVTATTPTATVQATVTVTSLTIAPAAVTITSGGKVQFTADPSTGVTWIVDGGGTITNGGLFTADTTSTGTFTVTATSVNGVAQAKVTINMPPLTLSPLVAMVQPNGTQQFNTNPSNATVTWTVSGGGTISTAGLFTANSTVGEYTVTAKSATETATATVYVTPLVVSPAYAILAPGQSQQFTANPNANNTDVTWSVVTTGGGSINSTSGMYTAPTQEGVYFIQAYNKTLNWTTIVKITVQTAGLVIDPAEVVLNVGDVQQFTADPPDNVVWTCTGGTITSDGVFTAGDVSGDFEVVATSPAGTTTAKVTIGQDLVVPGYETVPEAYNTIRNSVARAGVGSLRALTSQTIDAMCSWHFGSTGGDPLVTGDDNFSLVDRVLAYLQVQDAASDLEVGAGGVILRQPYIDAASQTAGFVWNTGDPLNDITVEFKLALVRDTLRWSYIVTNNMSISKRVRMRVSSDIKYLGAAGDRYTIPGRGTYNTVKEFVGSDVPEGWQVRYTPAGMPQGTEPILRAEQLLGESQGVTTPDRLVFAPMETLADYSWSEALHPQANTEPILDPSAYLFDSDGKGSMGVGCYYDLALISPRQSREITGEYRYNWSEVETKDHYALAVAGTEYLKYMPGDDPATPNQTEAGYFTPNEVTIRAYVSNSSQLAGTARISATIDPGQGLRLAAGQSATYSSVTVDQMQDFLLQRAADQPYSWKLVPTGMASGLLPVNVTATFAPGGQSITTTFYVNVPATGQLSLPGGIHFVSFPFQFADADPRAALGLGNWVDVAEYQPSTKAYRLAVDGGVALYPGNGYWLRLPAATDIALRGATPIDQTKTYPVQLTPGWNAIGNPFQYGIEWSKCYIYQNDQRYTIDEAIAKRLIARYLWTWNSRNNEYNTPGVTSQSGTISDAIQPYTGYWIFAYQSVGLVFTPNPYVPAMQRAATTTSVRVAGQPDKWQVNMVVQTATAKDSVNTFGVAQATRDSGDTNMMEPPTSPSGLTAYFVKTGARDGGNYAVLLQQPDSGSTWTFEVNCAKANEPVTISWPDMTQAAAKVAYVLVDEMSGQRISMRTSPSYTFNSGAGGVRRFTIQVGGDVARLQFTQATATSSREPGRGAAISYGTTVQATVTATIRTLTGKLVQTIDAGRSATDGGTVYWNGRDGRGGRMARGTYLCELYAVGDDGQRVRTVVTVQAR